MSWLRSPAIQAGLLILLVLILLQLIGSPQQLGFVRDVVVQEHQWLRLFTAQWIHLDAYHLANNAVGIVVIIALFGVHISTPVMFIIRVLVLTFVVALAVLCLAPEVNRFLGFSAIIYGLFAWGALLDVLHKRRLGWLLLLLVVGKTSYEYLSGSTWIALSGASQIGYSAHFFGMVAGIVLACFDDQKKKRRYV